MQQLRIRQRPLFLLLLQYLRAKTNNDPRVGNCLVGRICMGSAAGPRRFLPRAALGDCIYKTNQNGTFPLKNIDKVLDYHRLFEPPNVKAHGEGCAGQQHFRYGDSRIRLVHSW